MSQEVPGKKGSLYSDHPPRVPTLRCRLAPELVDLPLADAVLASTLMGSIGTREVLASNYHAVREVMVTVLVHLPQLEVKVLHCGTQPARPSEALQPAVRAYAAERGAVAHCSGTSACRSSSSRSARSVHKRVSKVISPAHRSAISG